MTRNLDPPESEEPASAPGEAINPRDIRLAAMDYLARREHLQRELQRKLRKRFAGSDAIAGVLQQLQEEGLQSDERFCKSYVRHRSGRGYGPERIALELRQKGAAADLVTLALEGCEVNWLALARNTRRKKFGDEIPADFKEKSRQMRFLQYRGFAGETIAQALNQENAQVGSNSFDQW